MAEITSIDDMHPSESFTVVGIGASAGGLEAIRQLVSSISEQCGMAFIIMQHFDPGYISMLPEILAKDTMLPVNNLTSDKAIVPNAIYVIPTDKIPVITNGKLSLMNRTTDEIIVFGIDVLFAAIAEIYGSNAVGILLSGMGADGTIGLKKIRDYGGVAFAQNPQSAAFGAMPQHAINANVVDFVMLPAEMPAQLLSIRTTLQSLPVSNNYTARQAEDESNFKRILALLRARRDVDFTYYKQTTIRRRILRRMVITRIEDLTKYLDYLHDNITEQDTLYQDLLIPVTSFFRDHAIFNTLCKKVFPEIFNEKRTPLPVRVWVAGCSTGEEAYSMAMCLHEFLGDKMSGLKIQLFATDISDKAIQKARSAMYTKREVEGVSAERLEQYFTKMDGHYHIKKNIRDLCVFATHNFLKDPPFAKMDLISCRNVMIYMESYLQKRALSTFHYALNDNGFLLLGKSESIGASAELFKPAVKQEKLYTRKNNAGRIGRFIPESIEREHSQPIEQIMHLSRKEDFDKNADDILLAKYVPAAVVVNEHFEIVQFRGATGIFLEPSPGKASLNILKMAREGLAFEIRNALHKARESREPVIKRQISLPGGEKLTTIEVVPLLQTREPYYLVMFREENPDFVANRIDDGESSNEQQQRIKQLETELAHLREDMRRITEDQEAANEELQSANEELLSGSEELQSLNEELETSKEELQSTNEELMTVNQELYDRNDQYNQARMYSEAIINTIREPLLVLNRDLRIKSANPAFYKEFGLKEDDINGKIIFELHDRKWDFPELRTPMLNIQTGQYMKLQWEVDLHLPDLPEKTMLLIAQHLMPENNEQLILLAFEDITLQKREAERLLQSAKKMENDLQMIEEFFSHSPTMFCILKGPDHVFEFANPSYMKATGGNTLTGRTFGEAFPHLENAGYNDILDNVYRNNIPFYGKEMKATQYKDGVQNSESFIDIICQPYKNENDETEGVLFFSYEVTPQVEARHMVERNAAVLENMVIERTKDMLQTNKALEQSNTNLQAFASIASHDLQEPLRKIRTFTGMLLDRHSKQLSPEGNQLLTKIELSSNRMSSLIKDVLNYSRILVPENSFVKTDLGMIFKNVLLDFELLITEKQAEIVLEGTLPILEAVPTQMNQLFYNLLGNALKFSSKERLPKITVSCKKLEDNESVALLLADFEQTYYEIIFTDNGIGFAPQFNEQIFSIFERLNSTSDYEGTGIGLALCRRIVQHHRGVIYAKGVESSGSIFRIVLPEAQKGINLDE